MANQTNQSTNIFWLDNPKVLLTDYSNLIPTSQMSYNKKLNSLTRFFILLAIILLLFCGFTDYLYIPIIGIVGLVIVYFITKKAEKTSSTVTNPISSDITNTNTNTNSNTNPVTDPFINHSGANVIDIDSLLEKSPSNDNDNSITFAEWVYSSPVTCKENPLACLRFEDVRYNKSPSE